MAIDRPWPVDAGLLDALPWRVAQSTAVFHFHDAGFFPIPFTGLGVFPLVVFFLALHQADLDLDPARFPVGPAALWCSPDERSGSRAVEFTATEQQFAGAGRIAYHVAGGGVQRQGSWSRTGRLPLHEDDIGFADVGLARPQGLHFPPLRGQAGFHALFDEVLVTGGSVECNGAGPALFLLFFLLMTGP